MRALTVLGFVLSGCSAAGLPFEVPGADDAGVASDLRAMSAAGHEAGQTAADLGLPLDLSVASPADLTVPPDFASPTDMIVPPDFAPLFDLMIMDWPPMSPVFGYGPLFADAATCSDPGDGGAPDADVVVAEGAWEASLAATSSLVLFATGRAQAKPTVFDGLAVNPVAMAEIAIKDGYVSYYPSALATDGMDAAIYVWETETNGAFAQTSYTDYKVTVTTSTDSGKTLRNRLDLAHSLNCGDPFIENSPSAAMAATGVAAVAWQHIDGGYPCYWGQQIASVDRHIELAWSPDRGVTFGPRIEVTDEPLVPTAGDSMPSIAAGPDGTTLVAWVWVDTDIYGSPNNRVMGQLFDPTGNKAGRNITISGDRDAPVDYPLAVAADPARPGTFYVAFVSGTPDGKWDVHVAATYDGGNTFQPSIKVNGDQTCAAHIHPAVAVDDSGRVHAAWKGNPSGEWDYFYSVSPPGDVHTPPAFGPAARITSQSMTRAFGNPALAVTKDQRVYMTYIDDNEAVHLRRVSP